MREYIIRECAIMIGNMSEDALIELRKMIDDRIRWINGEE